MTTLVMLHLNHHEDEVPGDSDGAGGGQQQGGRHAPHICEASPRVNSDVYIEELTNVVKPWMDGVAAGRPFIWCRRGRLPTRPRNPGLVRENLPFFWEKEVWPHSSPDCNPLDYFVWGVAERDTSRSPHKTKESLIASIKEVFSNFPREDLKKACSRFRLRLEAVATESNFIC